METKTIRKLINAAIKAKKHAYNPYSKLKVGAALLTKSNKIYTGCNIENVSYGLTNCAERTAIFKAVSEGERIFVVIAIVSDSYDLIPPCGACRQVLYEFGENIDVIIANISGKYEIHKIKDLIPFAFDKKILLK